MCGASLQMHRRGREAYSVQGRASVARCGSPTHTSGDKCLGHGRGQCSSSRTIPSQEFIEDVDSQFSPKSGEDRTTWSTVAENTQEPLLPLHISSPYSLGPGWQFVVPQHQAQQLLVNPVSRSQGCNVGLAAGLAGCCSLLQQRAQVRHGQATAQVCLAFLGRERVRGVLWQRHLKSCDKYGPLKGLSQRADIDIGS